MSEQVLADAPEDEPDESGTSAGASAAAGQPTVMTQDNT
jgi:hypothetical protein